MNRGSGDWLMMRLGVPAVAIGAIALMMAGCGGSSVSKANPDTLARSIKARSCLDSGFYLANRLDKSKAEVYDCIMADGDHKCVTEQAGIDQDVTESFRLFMEQTFTPESSKPICALG